MAALLVAGVVSAPASAQTPTVVANPGSVVIAVTGGTFGLGAFEVPLPGCDVTGGGCLSIPASLNADGTFSVRASDLQLPDIELPLEQLAQLTGGTGLPLGLRLVAFVDGPVTGVISPSTGLVRMNIALGVRLVPDLAALGLGSFASLLGSSAACQFGPVRLALTSGGSGAVQGVPYDPTNGAVTLVDGTAVVPPLTCGALITQFWPLLASQLAGSLGSVGDLGDLGGLPDSVDINSLASILAALNDLLGLPTEPGASTVRFEASFGSGADALSAPVLSGGVAWPASGFADVIPGDYFAEAVRWLKAMGITTGYAGSSTRYSPNITVTRDQMAAFLHRMMDLPLAPASCGLRDVPPAAYYARAACFLYAQGITTNNPYGPSGPVTRGQMAAFLWRMAGSPSVATPSGFTDVGSSVYYAEAVRWLKANGITTGYNGSATAFRPDLPVTRGQMAAFLYRLATNRGAWLAPTMMPTTATASLASVVR
jgi:hypothetical protein